MTAKEVQKRNEKAQQLKVLQVNDNVFYVESAEGKICYKVIFSDEEVSCTCGDFARNVKTDASFRCKHILAILNTEPGQMFKTDFLEKKKTGWIKVTVFGRLAEAAEKYLHKGARIGVIGLLDQQNWETDEGVKRSSFQILANSLEFIKTDGRGFEEDQTADDIPI